MDFLDIVFRLERRYGVNLQREHFEHVLTRMKAELTAGDLLEVVCGQLRCSGRPIPPSTWNGIRLEVARAFNISPFTIRRESKLVGDLGMK
jgi:hypothetical protein